MIIFTTQAITKFTPTKISTVIQWAGESFCLAEVPDTFAPTVKQMATAKLNFWWAVDHGLYLETEKWNYNMKWKGGLVEGIEWTYSLTKESNIAMCINVLAHNAAQTPFELWENTINHKELRKAS